MFVCVLNGSLHSEISMFQKPFIPGIHDVSLAQCLEQNTSLREVGDFTQRQLCHRKFCYISEISKETLTPPDLVNKMNDNSIACTIK